MQKTNKQISLFTFFFIYNLYFSIKLWRIEEHLNITIYYFFFSKVATFWSGPLIFSLHKHHSWILMPALSMVLIQDVNSEGGAQFCNEIGNLICLRRLSDKELSQIWNLFQKSHVFPDTHAQHVPSYHLTYKYHGRGLGSSVNIGSCLINHVNPGHTPHNW